MLKVSKTNPLENTTLYNFLDNHLLFNNSDKFVSQIVKYISENTKNHGGFETQEYLEENISNFVRVEDTKNNYFTPEQTKQIETIIWGNLLKARKEIKNPNQLNIFILPTQSEFILEFLEGVNGWCPSKDSIHLHIHSKSKLKVALPETVVHEYSHTVFRNTHSWETVEEGLIAEGLAEHFREYLLKGEIAPWADCMNEEEAFKWLKIIKPVLKSTKAKDYTDVFTNFNDNPYPHWTGYAIGYQLIKKFREKYDFSWEELTNMPAERVLTGIGECCDENIS